MVDRIKVSIITINLNNAFGLEQTLNSIFTQENVQFDSIESIIIDGDSQDTSKAVIDQYRNKISVFLSEKDRGVYDAMNKGIKYATGRYIWFLNSGDYLHSKLSLSKFIEAIDNPNSFDLIYSDLYVYKDNSFDKKVHPPFISFAYLVNKMINHQSYILKREYFQTENNFSLKYKIVSDWIFIFELFKKRNLSTHKIPLPLIVYDGNGLSISSGTLWSSERIQYLHSVYSEWELNCINRLSRLNSKSYFENLIRSLDSPKRTSLLSLIIRLIYI